MKSRLLLVLIAGVLATALAVPAQEAAASGQTGGSGGSVYIGTRALDGDKYLGLVSEYEISPEGLRPVAGASFWSQKGEIYFEAEGEHRGDGRDQRYSLRLDATRFFRVRSSFDRYVYRLEHDTLENLDAAKGSVVLRHDNFDKGAEYVPGRSELKTELTGAIPGLPFVRWKAAHRTVLEHGGVQARTLSKCANCHVTSVTKVIDQRTHEITAGLVLQVSRFLLEYDYGNRQFNEQGATPLMQYDVAIHPATLQNVFGNRVSFDAQQGLLPYSQVPDSRKSTHQARARVELPGEATLSAALVRSRAENKYSRLGIDSTAWSSKIVFPIRDRMTITARVRKHDVSSDDVFVDINEPTSAAGPQAGMTYDEGYPAFGSTDFWRYSVANRNKVDAGVEFAARLARMTTVRGGYQFQRLKRDNYEVDRTDINRVYANFQTRRSAGRMGDWSGRVRYTLQSTTDPFLHPKAALTPMLQPNASPGNPPSPILGTQYFTLYQARQADLTNQPALAQTLEPNFTWSPNARVSLTAHYRMKREKNDKLNYSTWERNVHMPGAELWVAPLEKLNVTLAYTFHREKSATLFVVPAFDG